MWVPDIVTTLEEILAIDSNDFRMVPRQALPPRPHPEPDVCVLRQLIAWKSRKLLQQFVVVCRHTDNIASQKTNGHASARVRKVLQSLCNALQELARWGTQACKVHPLGRTRDNLPHQFWEIIRMTIFQVLVDLLVLPIDPRRCLREVTNDCAMRDVPANIPVLQVLGVQRLPCCLPDIGQAFWQFVLLNVLQFGPNASRIRQDFNLFVAHCERSGKRGEGREQHEGQGSACKNLDA
mmetsp:Transcript_77285/g.201180  ORF Transcript_77285/g.201180 Transcript_77285/m.201180 type:complete len:237 (-) Transcript_77285:2-712(-)